MKLAKASVEEAEALLRWLQDRENAKFENAKDCPPAFSRTIAGYLLLLEHCADPAKDYLDFKPGMSPADVADLRAKAIRVMELYRAGYLVGKDDGGRSAHAIEQLIASALIPTSHV
jgi:hypothetical protein